jgi:hypothetical protein
MMEQRRGGSIVFVSSRGARRGEPNAPAYGASKAALNSLTGSAPFQGPGPMPSAYAQKQIPRTPHPNLHSFHLCTHTYTRLSLVTHTYMYGCACIQVLSRRRLGRTEFPSQPLHQDLLRPIWPSGCSRAPKAKASAHKVHGSVSGKPQTLMIANPNPEP